MKKVSKVPFIIIGAGCVGQVLGAHLHSSGHPISFLVKKNHIESLKKNGIKIQNYGRQAGRILEHPATIEHLSEYKNPTENLTPVVLVCVQSDQLPSIFSLIEEIPETYPIVFFQPGFEDRNLLLQKYPDKIWLQGNPGFSAYKEGNIIYNKVSWGFPTLISDARSKESSKLAEEIATCIHLSGVPAKSCVQLQDRLLPVFAFGIVFIFGARYHGWHFSALTEDRRFFVKIVKAAREACETVIENYKLSPPFLHRILFRLSPAWIKLLINIHFSDPESHQFRMWSSHSQKIETQTRKMIEDIQSMADSLGKDLPHLKEVVQIIEELERKEKSA